jgi:hypothetical protein
VTPCAWDDIRTWELVLPPNRPGAQTLRTVRRALRTMTPIRQAAVLGSTPEYVDLLHEVGVPEVTILERSRSFSTSMRAFRRFTATEETIIGDWRSSLADNAGRFDVVLSDFTLGNLPYEAHADFFRLVAASLSTRGRFIDRVLTYRQQCHDYPQLVRRFRSKPANLVSLNDFNAAWLFCGERVERLGVVDTAATYDWSMQQYGGSGVGWFISNCARISPRGMTWNYGKPWREIRKLYEHHLQLRFEWPEPAGSAYHGWAFVRESQRRSRASLTNGKPRQE